ncbi:MAG TPA: hypothetical protein VF711_08620, partial [Acidimicrobiales bacterium]
MAQAESPRKSVTPGEIVILTSGAVALIFSFLPWFKSSFGDETVNAWDSGLFPLATLIAIAGTIMAVQVLLERVLGVSMPRSLGEFAWHQIHVFLALFAFVIAFCYLLVDKGNADFDFGFYVDLLAAIGLVVGAFVLRQERRTRPAVADGGGMYGAPEAMSPAPQAPAGPTTTPAPPAPPTPPAPPAPPTTMPRPDEPPTWAPPPPP